MSLDVYLKSDVCEHCERGYKDIYLANITHNLGYMAAKAGIYGVLWRPNENGYYYAKDIVKILQKGLDDMKARPEYFKQFNAPNGWGLYEHFVPWVEKYLEACIKSPEAEISVSR